MEDDVEVELVDSMEGRLRNLVAPLTEEEIVSVSRFFPGNRWRRPDPLHIGRMGRRFVGRGRLDDRLSTFQNVMALTPTRILVYGTTTRTRRLALTKQFAEWQRAQVSPSPSRPEPLSTRR